MLQKSIAAQFMVVPTSNFFNDMVAALNSGIIVSAITVLQDWVYCVVLC